MSRLSEPLSTRDHIRGNPSANLILVEYGDYQCPYCGQAHGIVQKVLESIGDKVLFVFRNFPLSEIHPHALHAAASAEFAAKKGKFWEMHDSLFAHQAALADDRLAQYGEALGLDPAELVRAFEDEDILKLISSDFQSGIRSGANGTPTFFINGLRFDGSWDYDGLMAALTEQL